MSCGGAAQLLPDNVTGKMATTPALYMRVLGPSCLHKVGMEATMRQSYSLAKLPPQGQTESNDSLAAGGRSAATALHRALEALKPAESLSLEALGASSMLLALRSLANVGVLQDGVRDRPRFTPVPFQVPVVLPREDHHGNRRMALQLERQPGATGVRFMVARTSSAPHERQLGDQR